MTAHFIPSVLIYPGFLGHFGHQMQSHADRPLDARITREIGYSLEPLRKDFEGLRTAETHFFSITEKVGTHYTLQNRGQEGRRCLNFRSQHHPESGKTNYDLNFVSSRNGFTRGIAMFFSGGGEVRSFVYCHFEKGAKILDDLKFNFEMTHDASMSLLGQVINNRVYASDPYKSHHNRIEIFGEDRLWAETRSHSEPGPCYRMDYDSDQGLSIAFYKLPLAPLLRRRLWELDEL